MGLSGLLCQESGEEGAACLECWGDMVLILFLSGDREEKVDSLDQGRSRGQPSACLAWRAVPPGGRKVYVLPKRAQEAGR